MNTVIRALTSKAVSAALLMIVLFGLAVLRAEVPPAHLPLAEVTELIDAGKFKAAEAAISKSLAQSALRAADRTALEFQRERMRRILLDFTLSEAAAKAKIRKAIPDLRDEEFAAWDAAGLLEHQTIDGKRLYFSRAPSNLFRLSPAARARRKIPPDWEDGPLEKAHPHHREVIAQARATGRTSVAPRRIHVTQTITVAANAVPAGETVRAWVPYPARDPRPAGTYPAARQHAGEAQRRTAIQHAADGLSRAVCERRSSRRTFPSVTR